MTRRRLVMELVAEAPASFSRRAATEGAHQTLDGPTGASLMGWAASQCYEKLGVHAFPVFHSGRVHFSDAVRIVEGKAVFQAPATLLRPKHGAGRVCLGSLAFADEYHRDDNDWGRPAAEPVKGMQMSADGGLVRRSDRRLRLRSAMSRERRAAEDGMLFGTEAINARHAVYRAVIECDSHALPDDAWDTLQSAFQGKLSLGRARRSGYGGQYRVTSLPEDRSPFEDPSLKGIAIGEIARFWLLSDAQLIDAWGQPRLLPDASDFGLSAENWELIAVETAVATKRAAPWNSTYGSRDMEAALIEAGSIIAFRRTPSSGTPEVLPPLIGTGHQRGYGRYTVIGQGIVPHDLHTTRHNPEVLDEQGWRDLSSAHPHHVELLDWLWAGDTRGTGLEDPTWTQARIVEGRKKIDRMNGDHPSPSQWGEVLELVDSWTSEASDFAQSLEKRLARECWDRWYSGLDNWVKMTLFAKPEAGMTRQQRARAIERVIKALREYRPSDAVIAPQADKERAT